jgi:hypothetical protein
MLLQHPLKEPIKGIVPHPGATSPYSESSGFKISPIPLHIPLVLGVLSIICVAIELIALVKIY